MKPPALGPGQEAEHRKLAEALAKAMAGLTAMHRAVIVLKEIEGMSYDAIDAALGCSVGTVMFRLHYARKRLRRFPSRQIRRWERQPARSM